MKRVLVVGSGGAGKSAFARQLASQLDLPLIHLDAHYWLPNWTEPSKNAWSTTVARLLSEDAWVMDGNYGGTLERRIAACDTVVFLDLPRLLCLWRVVRRWWHYRGHVRPDVGADGCKERLSLSFMWWILTFPGPRRLALMKQLDSMRGAKRVVLLSSRRAVDHFLGSLSESPEVDLVYPRTPSANILTDAADIPDPAPSTP
jgi:adenylate kinase family enzyme